MDQEDQTAVRKFDEWMQKEHPEVKLTLWQARFAELWQAGFEKLCIGKSRMTGKTFFKKLLMEFDEVNGDEGGMEVLRRDLMIDENADGSHGS